MIIINTLLPVFLTIGLGYALARIGWFSETLVNQLNELLFKVCLPALIIHSLISAPSIPEGTGKLIAIFCTATFIVIVVSYGVFRALKLRPDQMGTFIQGAFRGNLAYTAIPIILYALRDEPEEKTTAALAQAIFIFAPTMLLYNIASVVVLVGSGSGSWRSNLPGMAEKVIRNPLIIASVAGVLLFLFPLELPSALVETIKLVGQMAGPAALLCVGAGMVFISMEGRYRNATFSSLLKVAVLPLISYLMALVWDVTGTQLLVLMIFSASPTAIVAYVITKELDGDVALAAGGIIISTILCIPALMIVLLLSL